MTARCYLADTNVLLRISQRNDPQYDAIRHALRKLRSDGIQVSYTPQNLVEFWNVCTRPAAVNGYGITIPETDRRARLIERSFSLLPDNEQVHEQWRKLVVAREVSGVQVHDARIVACVMVHGVKALLTLNVEDFRRYPDIEIVHPKDLIDGWRSP